MKKIIIGLSAWAMGLSLSPAANHEATLKVNTRTHYQTVTGFGGFAFSAQWGNNLTDAEITTLFGKGSKQLGYNVMRVRISPEERTTWGYDTWGTTASVIKKAKALGTCHTFASAWTPPGAFTSNGENTHGYMLESKFQDYTDFLNQFIDRMVSEGTDVDYISLQNEPDWEPDYEGCFWSAQTFINFYRDYAPKVKRPMIGPESLAFRRELSDSILMDDAACKNLAILGGHLYGGGNFRYPLAEEKQKPIWMTEYLIDKAKGDNSTYTWPEAILFARVVNTSMLAGMNAWCHYALKSSYGMMGNGDNGMSSGEVTKRGYALSHFAKYVSGTTRVKQTLHDPNYGLTTSCYESVTGDSIVVMVINRLSTAYNLTIDLPFKSKGGTKILTRSSSNMTTTALNFAESESPSIMVAASCIETFVLKKSGERALPIVEDKLPLYADHFTDYNGVNQVPLGWKETFRGKSYTGSSKQFSYYSNYPKLYYYSPESMIPAGLLLSATSSTNHGQATYGDISGHELYLEPGDYTLTYHAVGFKHAQKLYTYVRKQGASNSIAYHSGINVENHIEGAWGSQNDIFNATPDTLQFTVTTPGNYLLNWKVTYDAANVVDGSCDLLIGGIELHQQLTSGIETVTTDDAFVPTSTIYMDLSGKVITPSAPGFYIARSRDAQGRIHNKKLYIE